MRLAMKPILLALFFLLSAASNAAFTLDKHYSELPTVTQQNPVVKQQLVPGKIVVIEFFNYACPACYRISVPLRTWAQQHQHNVVFKRIPVIFHAQWRLFARVYYMAALLGVLDKIDKPLFDALHETHLDLSTRATLAEFFASFGVNKQAFNEAFDAFAVNRNMERSDMLRDLYKVYAVPSVIVNNRFKTDLGKVDNVQQFIQLLDTLVIKAAKAQ